MNPNPYQQPGTRGGLPPKPGRGAMILTFGILGLVVCMIFGIFAWVMGKADLAEMAAGRMDPNDQGMTKAGYILGLVSVLLTIVGIVFFIIFVAVIGGLSAAR